MVRPIAALAILAALSGCQSAPQPEPGHLAGDSAVAIGRGAGDDRPPQATGGGQQRAGHAISDQPDELTPPRSCYAADPTMLCF
jgi:hypothetical protein